MPAVTTVNWLFVCGLSFCLGGVVVLSLLPLGSDCICPISGTKASRKVQELHQPQVPRQPVFESPHKLAVLVPFRDRFEELLTFVPHLTKFLYRQNVNHHIFVLHQIDRYRFNRASLINVGFQFTRDVYDYIAMHDVDLLPLNDDLRYEYPSAGPLHIAAPELHPKYHYKTFVGGILLVTTEQFSRVNGMSNRYWGWGLEDDEFYVRIRDAGLQVNRPRGIKTGVNNTFSHIHNRYHRKRDTQKCFNQKEVTRKRDRHTGLNTLSYKIPKINEMIIDDISFTVVNILLECDLQDTPWCDCSEATSASPST